MTRDERKLQQWSERATIAIRWRNHYIVELHAAGHPLRHIGELAGVSHTAVAKILARG